MKKADKSDIAKKNILTKEGYDKLIGELEERKVTLREDIANKLEQATEQGDLSENAAYKTAMEEKELNENRIAELEEVLANSQVVGADNAASAGLGNKVTLKRIDTKDKYTYTLVGQSEANPAEGMISIESPVGKAVYGKYKGDKVTVKLPMAEVSYEIVEIK